MTVRSYTATLEGKEDHTEDFVSLDIVAETPGEALEKTTRRAAELWPGHRLSVRQLTISSSGSVVWRPGEAFRKPRPICPQCGHEAECYAWDIGGYMYCDEYVLRCVHCGCLERVNHGISCYGYDFPDCPFCCDDFDHHLVPPEELR
ncbi:MAG: hypothetical protein G01um1014106_419 [Parcubacteria group bacterium Gr01-1014_106]|nr:MAG: hypothetical protein G01um1014106_419 [Parcubacteria group bacterium Gr01-1014_106]